MAEEMAQSGLEAVGARRLSSGLLVHGRWCDGRLAAAVLMMSSDELNMAAYAARQEGRRDEALDLYDQAVNAFDAEGAPLKSAHALRHVADLQRELGNLDAARESIGTVVDLYEREPVAPLERANALRIAALVAEAEGRADEARRYWAEAGELYEQAGIADGVAEAKRRSGAVS